MPGFCPQCHVKSQAVAMPPVERRSWGGQAATVEVAASKLASLACQDRQAALPNMTHFPSSSCLSLRGSSPSWLFCFPQSDVSGEARMFSDVGGGEDHFSNFNVSCHFFHSGRIIIKYNLLWKSLVTASMCPKPDIWAGWPTRPYITSDFLINSFNLNWVLF